MKYLLHGDDTASSRKFLSGLVESFKTTTLEGKSLTVLSLEESLQSNSLFSEQKAVVVDNLFSQNSKKKDFVAFLNSSNSKTLLIFWEGKKLSKTSFSSLKNVTVQEFALPQFYFQFLDSLAPSNKKRVFSLYHELLASYAPEQLLFSLIKRVRQLVILSQNGTTDEIAKMAPWMRSKLQQQSRNWTSAALFSFYKNLQDAEIKLKTGTLPVNLSKHLDILLLTHL